MKGVVEPRSMKRGECPSTIDDHARILAQLLPLPPARRTLGPTIVCGASGSSARPRRLSPRTRFESLHVHARYDQRRRPYKSYRAKTEKSSICFLTTSLSATRTWSCDGNNAGKLSSPAWCRVDCLAGPGRTAFVPDSTARRMNAIVTAGMTSAAAPQC